MNVTSKNTCERYGKCICSTNTKYCCSVPYPNNPLVNLCVGNQSFKAKYNLKFSYYIDADYNIKTKYITAFGSGSTINIAHMNAKKQANIRAKNYILLHSYKGPFNNTKPPSNICVKNKNSNSLYKMSSTVTSSWTSKKYGFTTNYTAKVISQAKTEKLAEDKAYLKAKERSYKEAQRLGLLREKEIEKQEISLSRNNDEQHVNVENTVNTDYHNSNHNCSCNKNCNRDNVNHCCPDTHRNKCCSRNDCNYNICCKPNYIPIYQMYPCDINVSDCCC